MPEVTDTVPTPLKDFAPKLKFAITTAAQLLVGLTAVAASAAVTIYVAKNFANPVIINLPASD